MTMVIDKETKQLLEETAKEKLKYAIAHPEDDKGATKDAVDLLERATTIAQVSADNEDKRKRRAIERQKNSIMLACEREKQKITWQRAGLDLAKVIVPGLLSAVAFDIFQKRYFFFETKGIVSSWTGRQLTLPKFMKNL